MREATKVVVCACIYLAFVGEVWPQQNIRVPLQAVKELQNTLKSDIKQTYAEYSDDGRILVWNEFYLSPARDGMLQYLFRRAPGGSLERVGAQVIIAGMVYGETEGKWFPYGEMSLGDRIFTDGIVQFVTMANLATPHLHFVDSILATANADANPEIVAAAYDQKRTFDVTAAEKKGRIEFSDTTGKYEIILRSDGLISELKIYTDAHLHIRVLNEEIPTISFGTILSSFKNEKGQKVIFDPNAFDIKAFGASAVGISWSRVDSGFMAVAVVPNSPAASAGVKVGDRLVKLDGVDVNAVDTDALASLVHGGTATQEFLIKNPQGQTLLYRLTKTAPESWKVP